MLIDEGLEVLTEEQCLELLAGGPVGRVGVTMHGLPVIMPVNYALVDGDIIFRTSHGTKLQAATEHAVIAFEVDTHDAEGQSGWSVLAIGRSSSVTDEAEQAALDQYEITPWAGGERNTYVRLRPELISGRRIARECEL
jgi:nitroimidazol reductase NimA-like FMN-containing flavoprotein (pyridoxamine 5'-phosphate oxidase superfamily)